MNYEQAHSQNPKILIVEDDEHQLHIMTELIHDEGFEVTGCIRGIEAMQWLNQRIFDVVVVDLNLPDIKPEQFLKALIPFAESASIIINTGFASYESARDALNIGIFAYVEKADDPQVLLRHIYRACNTQLRRYSQDLEQAVEERTKALTQANEQLRMSEENYRSIFETAASLINSVTPDGVIVDCNQRIKAVLGYTKEELIGQNISRLIHPDDLHSATIILDQIFAQGHSYNKEIRMIRKEGTVIQVNINSSVFKDKQGECRTICIIDDITERKHAEARLLEYQAKLRSLASELTLTEERLRKNVATKLHDTVSQTLAMAKVEVASLREHITDTPVRQALTNVHDSLDRVLLDSRSLTSQLCFPILDILGFEKAVEKRLEEEIQGKYGLHTIFENDGQPKPLEEDVQAVLFRGVREILMNIIKHAHASIVEMSLLRENNDILVSIKDNGKGCDLATLQSQNNGFGMLSIDEALNRLGGSLTIQSEPGQGFTAIMRAPVKTKYPLDT